MADLPPAPFPAHLSPSGADTATIPAGTIIYYACECQCIGICTCPDTGLDFLENRSTDRFTGKDGCRFGTYLQYVIGMLLPYDGFIRVFKYRLTVDLVVDNSIYEFREINPQRFFDSVGHLIPNVINLLPEENTSHFEMACPVTRFGVLIPCQDLAADEGELFLTKENELNSLEFVESFAMDCRAGVA